MTEFMWTDSLQFIPGYSSSYLKINDRHDFFHIWVKLHHPMPPNLGCADPEF